MLCTQYIAMGSVKKIPDKAGGSIVMEALLGGEQGACFLKPQALLISVKYRWKIRIPNIFLPDLDGNPA